MITNAGVLASEEALSEYNAIPAGRCMHLTDATSSNETPVAKLGCNGNRKLPVFIFRPSDSFSAGFEGPSSETEFGPTWATGTEKKLLMFVGLEGTELMTTEFDRTRTYKQGDYLRSPELGDDGAGDAVDAQTIAGMLTNDNVVHGVHTIVGMVSPGSGSPMNDTAERDVYGNYVLSLHTMYKPPIEGLLTAASTNLF